MKRSTFVLSLTAAAAVPGFADAQSMGLQDAVARLFTAKTLQTAWFTPAMLAAVPIDKMRTIVDDIVTVLGPYQSIAANGSRFTVAFARGTIQAEGSVDGSGAIAGILFTRMQSAAAAQALQTIFTAKPVPAALFGNGFTAAVPIDKIRTLVTQVQEQFGAFTGALPAKDGSYTVAFANGAVAALIFLGPTGKIEGLIFQPR